MDRERRNPFHGLVDSISEWNRMRELGSGRIGPETGEERAARFFPSNLPEDVLATGGIAGDGTLQELLAHARATGQEAARRAGRTARRLRAGIPQRADEQEGSESSPVAIPELPISDHPALFRGKTHGIVDYSEDVTSKDLVAAEKEGYDSIELVKRYTTVTMGPAQGKPELVWQSEVEDRPRLVGLQPHDGSLVPPEACQIVEGKNDEVVGRITSSRMSPTLGRSICLGFVAPHLTTPGTKVMVQLPGGERILASVTPHHAHYDPEGTRQRG